ncbi:MAG: cupredoxin domain-containing protein [Thermoleophilaceae bacterium]|nr:cupredoxin domain-containing protein [Thermoleophilaceae bacterium]
MIKLDRESKQIKVDTRLVVVFLMCLGLALAALSANAVASTKSITLNDDFFSPGTLTIAKNDKIKFVWNETSHRHNVTVKSGPRSFHSSTKRSGTYTKKFTTRGTYKIHCTIHSDKMKLTVKVK